MQPEGRGVLIVFEGPDGAGKTTQRKLFKTWLEGEGWKVSTTKWNSSPLIRPLVKTRKAAHSLGPEEFCLLHAADFQHRLETEILPALQQGRVVLADRYFFTSLARDASRGLDLKWLLNVYQPIHWPDVVVYFSVSPETSARRVAGDRTPHFYEAGQDVTGLEDPFASYAQFIRRVIGEYETMAPFFRFVKVDAEQPIYAQHLSIREVFQEFCPGRVSLENMTKGKLIALEGAWGPSVAGAAEELLRRATDGVQPGKISEWDASGIFGELRLSEPGMARPSPRTLVLLYAADLAFRLRREILPALEEGRCVVAAPYVQSAIAFGTAAGLPRRWLVDLFRFAPEPQERYRLRESRRGGLGQISGWPPTDRSIRSTAGLSPGPTPSPQPRAGSPD